MEPNKLFTFTKVSIFSAIVGLAMLAGYGYSLHGGPAISEVHAAATPAPPAPSAATETPRGASVVLPDFADIVAKQGPAVVNISVAGTIKTAFSRIPGLPKLDPDDPFSEFFKRFEIPMPRGGVPARGQGSGFIVSSDGVILTNAHVVADADEVTVKLTDRREFKAKVIGVDKVSDVAVLKIDAARLPAVTIGEPSRARVGEWVVAIGSPFGFENSVTAGIISAKSRSLPDEGYVPFLQTDVAMKVERQLVDHGKVSRGRRGVMIQQVDAQLAESFNLDKAAGALVSSVERGSPADKAGIEPGDVILKFNGKEISRSSDLPPLVADLAPGTRAELQIWHQGKSRSVSVNLGEMKVADSGERAGPVAKGKLGLAVRPLTADERKDAEVAEGLVVENVNDGPAARAGIRPGDIILSVNGEKVGSVDQLRSIVDKKSRHIALQVLRGDQKLFVPINLG